jgi:hypothetical protein
MKAATFGLSHIALKVANLDRAVAFAPLTSAD